MTELVRRPDFFLVGAPRCATTAMFAFLGQHPQIFLPLRKEVHYFGSDLVRRPGNPWFITRQEDYLDLFTPAEPQQVIGEASVLYLYSATAAAEIKRFQPTARIVIQLRNPVDMLYSYHGQNLLAVQEDIEDFEQAYAAVEARRRGQRVPRWCIMPQQLLYPDIAAYTAQVERYFAAFGRERVYVMIYDDFRRDPAAEFARILRFLCVDSDFRTPFPPINSHRQVRCKRLQGETQLPSWPTRCLLRPLSDRQRYLALIHLATLNSRPAIRAPLRTAFRARLAAEFAGEVDALSGLLDRDLSHWTHPERAT